VSLNLSLIRYIHIWLIYLGSFDLSKSKSKYWSIIYRTRCVECHLIGCQSWKITWSPHDNPLGWRDPRFRVKATTPLRTWFAWGHDSDIAVVSATGAVDISSYIFVCAPADRSKSSHPTHLNPPQCLLAHSRPPAECALSMPLLCWSRAENKSGLFVAVFLTLFIFRLYQKNLPAPTYLSFKNSLIRQFSLDCEAVHLVHSLGKDNQYRVNFPNILQ